MSIKKYNFIDLFAGAGGLSLGLTQAGFNMIFANEIDKVASQTILLNHNKLSKDNLFIGDIRILNQNISYLKQFQQVDLVTGGPPCQGFSIANQQRMIDDPRNILYKEYITFIKHTKPKFFLMENVKGMRNKISEIIDDFNSNLDEKYSISYAILNAKDFGVPQNRERLFIIGNCINIDSNQIFNELKQQQHKQFFLFDAISDLPPLHPKRIKNNNSIENEKFGFTEIEFEYKQTNFVKYINNNRTIQKLYNHKNRFNNDRDIEIYKLLPQGCNSTHDSIQHIMPYKERAHIFKDKYYKLKYNEVSRTITSHMQYDCNMYIHPEQSRGLSPREAARIQTFPDDYYFCGSQNNWYKQIGNAVPVKLSEAIGRIILKYLV
jgi:DNA (cytosine-5)-methyltransferase 1